MPTQIVLEMLLQSRLKKVRSVSSPSAEAICWPKGTPMSKTG